MLVRPVGRYCYACRFTSYGALSSTCCPQVVVRPFPACRVPQPDSQQPSRQAPNGYAHPAASGAQECWHGPFSWYNDQVTCLAHAHDTTFAYHHMPEACCEHRLHCCCNSPAQRKAALIIFFINARTVSVWHLATGVLQCLSHIWLCHITVCYYIPAYSSICHVQNIGSLHQNSCWRLWQWPCRDSWHSTHQVSCTLKLCLIVNALRLPCSLLPTFPLPAFPIPFFSPPRHLPLLSSHSTHL